MIRYSTRRMIASSALVLGLVAGVVACGGDESSDLSREDLLAVLAAVQVDPEVAQSLSDEQLQAAVDQVFAGLDDLPAPDTTVSETPDVTAGGDSASPEPTNSEAPADTVAPAPEESTAPADDGGSTSPFPSVVITLPGVSIPIGNISQLASTLGVKDLSVVEGTKFNRLDITVTEFGFGTTELERVDVVVNAGGVTKEFSARRSSNTSNTESVWFVEVTPWTETARISVTVRDSRGETAGRSFVINP